MSLKVAKEQLGRVKPYFLRKQTLRALTAAINGLRELGTTPPPTEVRSVLREALQLLTRDEEIRKYVNDNALAYQAGKEPLILQHLLMAYQAIKQDLDKEDHDTALARKIRLDQAYNRGIALLAQHKASEADASFAEALTFYRDEHTIYPMIGKAMLEAGEIRRALPYLKKAQTLLPTDSSVKELFETCARMRAQLR